MKGLKIMNLKIYKIIDNCKLVKNNNSIIALGLIAVMLLSGCSNYKKQKPIINTVYQPTKIEQKVNDVVSNNNSLNTISESTIDDYSVKLGNNQYKIFNEYINFIDIEQYYEHLYNIDIAYINMYSNI